MTKRDVFSWLKFMFILALICILANRVADHINFDNEDRSKRVSVESELSKQISELKEEIATKNTTIIEDETMPSLWDGVETLPEPSGSPLPSLFKVTAYCHCKSCCGKSQDDSGYMITASGAKVEEGVTVAADSKVLPYGTIVYIEGIGRRIVQDTGAFHGNRLDVYYPSHQTASDFGVQTLKVWVIK